MISRIELLGVPGSGKSSLLPEVISELRSASHSAAGIGDALCAALRTGMQDRLVGQAMRRIPRPLRRRYYKQIAARSQDPMLALRRFLLEHPDIAIAVLDAMSMRRNIDRRQDLALGWIVEFLWQYQLVTTTSDAPFSHLVLDEGFCNRAITLFGYRYSERDEPYLRRYIQSIPKPDLVIVVTRDAKAAAAREPRWLRVGPLTDDEAIVFTQEAEACVHATQQLLIELGVDVRELRNTGTLGESSDQIRRIILDWLDPEQ